MQMTRRNKCAPIIICHNLRLKSMKMGAKSHPNYFRNPASLEIVAAVLHLHAKQEIMFWNIT